MPRARSPPAGQRPPLNVTPLAMRGVNLSGSIDLDSLPDDRDSPESTDYEDNDSHIDEIPGVRSLGNKRRRPYLPRSAAPKVQAVAAWSPNHSILSLPQKLEFSPTNKLTGSLVTEKGKSAVDANLLDLESMNDPENLRMWITLTENVSAQKAKAEKYRNDWRETLADKEETILKLKNEIRVAQDDLVRHKREVEDLKTIHKRDIEDLKDGLLKQNTANDSEIEELKNAVAEHDIKTARLITRHKTEMESTKASIEDRYRIRLEKVKAAIYAALEYSSEPESSSVKLNIQLDTQVSLSKQEEKPGDSAKL